MNNEEIIVKNEEMTDIPSANKLYPLIPLRGKVLFPNTVLNFEVGRERSLAAAENAIGGDNLVFIVTQKSASIENPQKEDLYSVGVVAKIQRSARSPKSMKLTVQAVEVAKIVGFIESEGFICVETEKLTYSTESSEVDIEAGFRLARTAFLEYAVFDKRITKEMIALIGDIKNPDAFINNALSVTPFKLEDCYGLLAETDTYLRLTGFYAVCVKEREIMSIERDISGKVKENIDKSQKEYYLREQIKAIHSELGDDADEIETLKEKIEKKGLPEEIKGKALQEINRLDKINPSSPDYSVILNYIDWLLDTPFSEHTEDTESLADAEKVLNSDHFGLEKVKQRILEYIAVLHLTKEIKGPILCFVGPPGVGKTSVASSIARALGRKFVRMSLGGVKDEAEIRGHRRTYVGAMPGRIIYGLKNAGVNNPVFLLDEIDKLSSDMRGDPASALLEVLDPEQNSTFRDRFMEIPYDLSKVIFITTANSTDTIPAPLLDRMEIIELSGYTGEEKLQIAKQYLIPKELKNNGLKEKYIEFTDEGIREIISGYTMEAGVRNLEREIAGVIRKVAAKVVDKPRSKKTVITPKTVGEMLGKKKGLRDLALENDEVGACTGLAWTSVGGTTLTIEAVLMKGKGEILLTGKLGDVMKESARTAISFIRSRADKYGIADDAFEKTDIHVHVPEGATPKDGPSAGITIATAIFSAFTGKSVKKGVAMTGEITLRGKVLPIGGLKEKALAAYRLGIKTVIIPKGNEKDLEDIPQEIKRDMKFIPVSGVDEVFGQAVNL